MTKITTENDSLADTKSVQTQILKEHFKQPKMIANKPLQSGFQAPTKVHAQHDSLVVSVLC